MDVRLEATSFAWKSLVGSRHDRIAFYFLYVALPAVYTLPLYTLDFLRRAEWDGNFPSQVDIWPRKQTLGTEALTSIPYCMAALFLPSLLALNVCLVNVRAFQAKVSVQIL